MKKGMLNLLIFSLELLIIGYGIGTIVERKRIKDQAEKDEIFDQFCEILIDSGDGIDEIWGIE